MVIKIRVKLMIQDIKSLVIVDNWSKGTDENGINHNVEKQLMS